MGRGDRTPEIDENSRTTVGVDLHSHELRDGTECKIYDVAGQVLWRWRCLRRFGRRELPFWCHCAEKYGAPLHNKSNAISVIRGR